MNLLKKIFSPSILLISFLLLIYTFYKSEIFFGGGNRNYYKSYYFISLIFIFFSIISFFISSKIKEYLIILGISLVISLYSFEGYFTFIKPSIKQFSKERLYEDQTGKKWDKRSKFELYKDLKRNNDKINVIYTPEALIEEKYSTVPLPLSGLSNTNTINCNENGYYSIYQSDRYGFNNPDYEWSNEEIEYLLVGDSFTHGACVNRGKDISSVLRNLSNKSVLNLGMSGNGPLIQYATLREYLNTNVRKVLWIYFEGNDFYNLKEEINNNILASYLKDINFTQNLKLKQNEIDSLLSNLIIEKHRKTEINNFVFELIEFIKISNIRHLIFPPPEVPEEKQRAELAARGTSAPEVEFKKILKLTKEFANKNNSKLYFVYLPQYYRYTTDYNNANYNLVKNIVDELKITFIDIHEKVFEKEQNPLKLFPFEKNGHYNINGYKKVAETIFKFTKD